MNLAWLNNFKSQAYLSEDFKLVMKEGDECMMKSAMLIGEPALGALYPSDKGHTPMTSLSNCHKYYMHKLVVSSVFGIAWATNVDVMWVCLPKINVGILHLDPDAEYPEHVHYAEEIYQVDLAVGKKKQLSNCNPGQFMIIGRQREGLLVPWV